MARKVKVGGTYLHFKGGLYVVDAIARHTESREYMVIYHGMDKDRTVVLARPMTMFLSEVDHRKYPDVKQKYRFEEVDFPEWQ